MELLLALLSLLTAATGAVAGVRAPEAGVHQAAGIVAVAPARRAAPRAFVAATVRPAQAAEEMAPDAADAPSSAPLYANRRRE